MRVYIIFGVSGTGKTTIGSLLSDYLKIPFYDADDFHPQENLMKMENGQSLTDHDRLPWLKQLSNCIDGWTKMNGAVLACSALKKSYREILAGENSERIEWIYLFQEMDLITKRLKMRKNHFFKEGMLQSQFNDLEPPKSGLYVDVKMTPNEIIDFIKENIIIKKMTKSEFGLIGLGVMGKSLAVNLASKGVALSVYNRHVTGHEEDVAKNFVAANSKLSNLRGYDDLGEFLNAMDTPRKILLMVNAGAAVDDMIAQLQPHLNQGDVIIDGGNSHFLDTNKRVEVLKSVGIEFVGTGISGGEEGARKGPSIMPGGSVGGYKKTGAYLEMIAAKDKNGNACCSFVGKGGAGHFVKMIHNGIEYADMQLIAELYHALRYGANMSPIEISNVFEDWMEDDLNSYLLEITVDILRVREKDGFLIDSILDAAGQKGTGGWSTIAALNLGKPLSTISEAVMARNLSAMKEVRVKAEALYGQESMPGFSDIKAFVKALKGAYIGARLTNHAIGFDVMRQASIENDWSLQYSEIARVWTSGCIIRSKLMEDLTSWLHEFEGENLLLHPEVIKKMKHVRGDMAVVLSECVKSGFSTPVLSAANNYFLGFTSGQSSANIIQAQRDYFGAHTYKRKDADPDKTFHTDWKSLT